MSFRTQGRVDVEPPSVANSLHGCATASPQALQGTADADVVDDLEDEVVAVFFSPNYPWSFITLRYRLALIYSMSS
jgi:hypothetical protein